MVKFLTCDPSLRNTAFVWGEIVDGGLIPKEYKLIQTEKSKNKKIRASSDLIERCRKLKDGTLKVLERVNPDIIFIETPSGSQSYHSAVSYAVSCGVVALLSPPPIEVTPTELKKSTVGRPNASKNDIKKYVQDNFPLFELPMYNGKLNMSKAEHVCDAICAAVTGMKTTQYKQLQKFL